MEALTEAVADGDKKLRRRAMAALGELLFYVATQQRNAAQARSRWCHKLLNALRWLLCSIWFRSSTVAVSGSNQCRPYDGL